MTRKKTLSRARRDHICVYVINMYSSLDGFGDRISTVDFVIAIAAGNNAAVIIGVGGVRSVAGMGGVSDEGSNGGGQRRREVGVAGEGVDGVRQRVLLGGLVRWH